MKKKIFYGWIIVAMAVLSGGLIQYLSISTIGLFVVPVTASMGISTAAFMIAATLNSISAVFGGIIGGKILDSKGARFDGVLSALIAAVSFAILGFAKTLPVLYIGYLVGGLGYSMGTTVLCNTLVSKWFVKYRNIATSITSSGASVFSFLLSTVLAGFIQANGFNNAYFLIAGLCVVSAVIALIFFRNDPAEMGLLPDGALEDSRQKADDKAMPLTIGLTSDEAMKTVSFWKIVICYAIWSFCSLGILQTYNAHLQSRGFSAIKAAGIVSLVGIVSIVAKIVSGAVTEKFQAKYSLAVGWIVMAASIIVLTLVFDPDNMLIPYAYVVLYTIGNGMGFVVMTKLTVSVFGTKAFGAINGMMFSAMSAGGLAGPVLAGVIFDLNGSYNNAYYVFAISLVLAAVLILSVKDEIGKAISN